MLGENKSKSRKVTNPGNQQKDTGLKKTTTDHLDPPIQQEEDQVQAQADPTKQSKFMKKFEFKAPFDLFGTSQRFYVRGKDKTLTWIGCFCSLVLTTSIVFICLFYVQSYTRKATAVINSFDTKLEESENFDLGAGQQILIIEHYDWTGGDLPYDKYSRLEYY